MSLETPTKSKRKRNKSGGSSSGGTGGGGKLDVSAGPDSIGDAKSAKTRLVDGYRSDQGLYPHPEVDASLIHFKEAVLESAANSVAPMFSIQAAVGELIRVSWKTQTQT